jgi:hypothetical protein
MWAWPMGSAADSCSCLRVRAAAGALSAAFLCLPVTAGADLFKWVDANGKVHYSDSAPRDTKSQKLDLKINSIAGPPVVSRRGGTN